MDNERFENLFFYDSRFHVFTDSNFLLLLLYIYITGDLKIYFVSGFRNGGKLKFEIMQSFFSVFIDICYKDIRHNAGKLFDLVF